MYTDGLEMFYIVYDNVGATKSDWFSRSRILGSTATDLTPSSTSTYFSLIGYTTIITVIVIMHCKRTSYTCSLMLLNENKV